MPKKPLFAQKLDALHKRQAALEKIIQKAINAVGRAVAGREPRIFSKFFYGATGVDAKHLVVWYLFKTDAQMAAAEKSGLLVDLDALTRAELRARGYPLPAIPKMMVSFATDETIRRETGGDYWQYFK
jgi:hypothetical protein